jgi:hypothetical protein
MSFKVFVTKYKNQLKAINPKYDEIFSINSDEPIEFLDGDNVRVSFASIADTQRYESGQETTEDFWQSVNGESEWWEDI